MKKLLLITSRNIYEPTGEYSLINRRAEALYKYYKMKTDIISFQSNNRINSCYKDLLDNSCYDIIISVGYSLVSILSSFKKLKIQTKKYLYNNMPEHIIVSGSLIGILYNILVNYKNKTHCKIYYDMHGCLEELIEYPHPKLKYKFLSYLFYKLYKIFERKLLNISNGVLIVSCYMKTYLMEKYNLGNLIKFYYIPCGIDKYFRESTDRIEYRKNWRNDIGLNGDDIVFVYSGGTSKWQMIDNIIELFESELKRIPNSKMCFFSRDIDVIKDKVIYKKYNLNNYVFISLDKNEVIKALTACDCGILLREETMTNKVAFPNKFSEYVAAGLNCIITTSLVSPAEIVSKYKIGYIYDINKNSNIAKEIESMIQIRNNNLIEFYKICDNVINYELNYEKNLEMFANDISNN